MLQRRFRTVKQQFGPCTPLLPGLDLRGENSVYKPPLAQLQVGLEASASQVLVQGAGSLFKV